MFDFSQGITDLVTASGTLRSSCVPGTTESVRKKHSCDNVGKKGIVP